MKTISSFLRRLVRIAALVSLASCAGRPVASPEAARRELTERLRSKPEPAILFVGNSYSFGVPRAFARLARERGKAVVVDQSTYSGWTLARHRTDERTQRKIHEKRWDVIVIQEHSRTPSLEFLRPVMMFPAVRSLADEARAGGAIPVLYQTWGWRHGDPKRRGDDFHAMTGRVRDGYRAASRKAGGLVVVPAGDAWEREFSAGKADLLFLPDGSHPTPHANALTAGVFFDTFFGNDR